MPCVALGCEYESHDGPHSFDDDMNARHVLLAELVPRYADNGVIFSRYEAEWDPVVYSWTTPWCVQLTTEQGIYSAIGNTEADAMIAAFELLPNP
jgi:hypothetical protein